MGFGFFETQIFPGGGGILVYYNHVPFKDPQYLLELILKRTHLLYSEEVELYTTNRSGKVDGAWVKRPDEFTGIRTWQHSYWYPGANNVRIPMKYYGLIGMGELVSAYCHHPEADPKLVKKTYREWPLMVEMRLPKNWWTMIQ